MPKSKPRTETAEIVGRAPVPVSSAGRRRDPSRRSEDSGLRPGSAAAAVLPNGMRRLDGVPDFLRIPQEQRAAAWEGRTLTTPAVAGATVLVVPPGMPEGMLALAETLGYRLTESMMRDPATFEALQVMERYRAPRQAEKEEKLAGLRAANPRRLKRVGLPIKTLAAELKTRRSFVKRALKAAKFPRPGAGWYFSDQVLPEVRRIVLEALAARAVASSRDREGERGDVVPGKAERHGKSRGRAVDVGATTKRGVRAAESGSDGPAPRAAPKTGRAARERPAAARGARRRAGVKRVADKRGQR